MSAPPESRISDRRYAPVGYCIYCRRKDEPLSDEHIIPYGLNGTKKLRQASCAACAGVTGDFERELLRGEMQQVRSALGFQSRKSKPKETFPLLVTRNGLEERVDAPLRDHLLILPLPLYRPPAEIEPYDYAAGIERTGVQTLRFGPDPEALRQRYRAEKIGLELRVDHDLFARLLAKIAYSFAVGELGADRIGRVHVLPTIFGDMAETGRWIGSSRDVLPAEPSTTQHAARLQAFEGGGRSLIVVSLKLFANVPSPGYVILVGELAESSGRGG